MRLSLLAVISIAAFTPSLARAWGNEGHKIIAAIAESELKPEVKAKVDALLAADTSNLTAHDIESEATWADAYRADGHRETAPWHYVDVELDHPSLEQACFGYPKLTGPASLGPENDCVVDKIEEFAAELADPAAPEPERILALKYLLHFVGDLHQPLHGSDNHDRGGNCDKVAANHARNLHAYWDTTVVEMLGYDPNAVAAKLEPQITPEQQAAWSKGDAKTWALDTFLVGKNVAYTLNTPATCEDGGGAMSLPPDYQARAKAAAEVQLEKAGVRLAAVLNKALGASPSP